MNAQSEQIIVTQMLHVQMSQGHLLVLAIPDIAGMALHATVNI